MQKNYLYIGKGLMLASAVRRFNKRFDSRLQMHHLRILYLLKVTSWPPLRVEIIRHHKDLSCKMNYTLLNRSLFYLEQENMVSSWSKDGCKAFRLTPRGIELLAWIENNVRAARQTV